MEGSLSPTSTAIGARFKAGLQSVLNGFGKSSSGNTSPAKLVSVEGTAAKAEVGQAISPSNNVEESELCASDALLGESEHGEKYDNTADYDDALLEDDASQANSLGRVEEEPQCKKLCTGLSEKLGAKTLHPELGVTVENGGEMVKKETSNNQQATQLPPVTGTYLNGINISKNLSGIKLEKLRLQNEGVGDIDKNTFTVEREKSDVNCIIEVKFKTIESDSRKLDNSEGLENNCEQQSNGLETPDNNPKLKGENLEALEKDSENPNVNFGPPKEIAETLKGCNLPEDNFTVVRDNSQTITKETCNNVCDAELKSIMEDIYEVPNMEEIQNQANKTSLDLLKKDENTDMVDEITSLSQSGSDGVVDMIESEQAKEECTSPERARSADSDGFVSPPSLDKSARELGSDSTPQTDNDHSRSYTPPTDTELVLDESEEHRASPSPLDIKHAMEDLVGKAVAKVDGYPVSSVCTQRASPHVSPSNSDDEAGGDLVIGAASAEENSEDDCSRDGSSAKRAKLSPSAADAEGGRLNKLISHLSTTLEDSNGSGSAILPEDMDEDYESIHLKKNGLASFYDAIIKADVIRESYHKELSRKHQELQIKNNMDSRKITKILQEVKAVREKIKLMNVRSAQRSVSTQIFSEKLLAPADQPGNKIIKSTVLSQKALLEQKKAIEAKRKAEEEAARLAVVRASELERAKAIADLKKLAPKVASYPVQTGSPSFSTTPRASLRPPPAVARTPPKHSNLPITVATVRTPPPKAMPKPQSDKLSSEVIDLTAEEDAAKTTNNVTSATNGDVPPVLGSDGLNMFQSARPVLPHHPAPLPQCPLTGKPGHLLKPPVPKLDLNSKEDGIVLQWNMLLTKTHSKISTYQIFGYKERPGPLSGSEWKKVGDLKALPLPMACTLTQFQTGHTYHFAVRAVDELGRTGPFGEPRSTKLG